MADIRDSHAPATPQSPLVLPTELWLEMINYLRAKDIIALISTCKAFQALLDQRTVWISILHSVCREDSIFSPSYDTNTMDVQELRQAAMGRYRWGRLLEQNCLELAQGSLTNPNVLKPASGPISLPLPRALTVEHDPFDYGRCLYLIPGGRYLVLADFQSVRLVDLGVAGKSPLATPVEVARVIFGKVEKSFQQVRLLAWPHEETRIRVAVGMESESGDFFSVNIYTIQPTQPTPEFTALGSVLVVSDEYSWWQMQVNRNFLYVGSDYTGGVVWDFEHGLYIPVSTFQNVGEVEHEVFTGDFVARFTPHELHLLQILPPELPVPPDGRITLTRVVEATPSDMVFPYPFLKSHVGTPDLVILLSPSQPHMSFPITLDAYPLPSITNKSDSNDNDDDKNRTSRYTVNIVRPNHQPKEPSAPLEVKFELKATYFLPPSLHDLELLDDQSPLDMGYPSRTLVEVYDTDGRVVYLCVLSVLPPNSNPENPDESSSSGSTPLRSYKKETSAGRTTGQNASLTILHQDLAIDACILCSSSGRSVYSERREVEGTPSQQICVVDYLS